MTRISPLPKSRPGIPILRTLLALVAVGSGSTMVDGPAQAVAQAGVGSWETLPAARVNDITSHVGCVAPIPSPVPS